MIRLCQSGHSFVLAVIYRPGSSTPTDQFFEEFEQVVDSVRRLAPWFDGDCPVPKKTTRRLGQVYRCTRQPQCRDSWRQALADYRTLLRQKEQQYWSRRITDAAQNPRSLWNLLNVLLHSKNADPRFTANEEFATFLQND